MRPPDPGAARAPRSGEAALDAVLTDLLGRGTLGQEQATAVAEAYAARTARTGAGPTEPTTAIRPTEPVTATGPQQPATATTPTEPTTATGPTAPATAIAPSRPGAGTWRDRLLEAAVYLGAGFVVAAAALVVGQQWEGMARGLRVALALGLAVVGLVAGLATGWPVRPAWRGPLDADLAVRRRSASTILTATAALAAWATAVVLDEGSTTVVAACGAALAVAVLTQVVAPSVLSEVALFAAATAFVGASAAEVFAAPAADGTGLADRGVPATLLVLGAAWAWAASRILRQRLLGIASGLALAVVAALILGDDTTTPATLAMAVLAAATLLTYLRDPVWPWVTAAAVAATLSVFLVAGDTLGPAVGFLVAGLALLAGVGVVVLRRRRRQRLGDGSA